MKEAELSDYIKDNGNKLGIIRGTDLYSMEIEPQLISTLSAYSIPKLNKIITLPKIKKNNINAIFAIKGGSIYQIMYYILGSKKLKAQIISYYSHQTKGWQIDLQLFFLGFQKIMKRKGVSMLTLEYKAKKDGSPFLEKLLLKQKWEQPHTFLNSIILRDINPGLNQPFYYRKIDDGYEIVQMSTEGLDELKKDVETLPDWVDFPNMLSPFQMIDKIAFDYSFLLLNKENGRYIGWCLAHQMNEKLIRITNLYVHDKKVPNAGLRMIGKFAEKIKSNKETALNVQFNVTADNRKMLLAAKMIARKLPHDIIETRRIKKYLINKILLKKPWEVNN